METIYIYTLIDPRDGLVRYVGKTNNLLRRMEQHLRRARKGTAPVAMSAWFAELIAEGLLPIMKVVEETNRANSDERELYWMKETGADLNRELLPPHPDRVAQSETREIPRKNFVVEYERNGIGKKEIVGFTGYPDGPSLDEDVARKALNVLRLNEGIVWEEDYSHGYRVTRGGVRKLDTAEDYNPDYE